MAQLEELFHEALELKPGERAEFISGVAKSDPELAAAVESLLAAHEGADGLIDTPAYEAAAEIIAEVPAALVAGQVVGHYRIIAPLGRGGMGEVYLASDTKLDRRVALKLLPAEFTNHKERLRRFIQEAKTASSLNHPNIITIHEIGEVDGAPFIATEFIDGQTLKRRKRTKMELPEILDVSIQVASALQAAHAAGIIHRDIKPENIMLRPDGYVKVLDFGLAKLSEKSGLSKAGHSEIDTMVKGHTQPGTVLGTVDYMSPEQARGQTLDRRTDVFSLGIVLYQMAAGRTPFAAATSLDTLVSILEKEPPPLDDYAPEVPAEFQRIVSKALRKDREERYQTMKDLLIDLRSFKEEQAFEQKLSRSRPPRAMAGPAVTPAATNALMIDQTRSVAAATDAQPQKQEVHRNRRVMPIALACVVLAGLAIGVMLWRRSRSGPATTVPATAVQRTVSYWITVQKYRNGKPYQEPFRLSDDINFEKDYRIRLNIASSQSGRLYLLNEGPAGADQTPTFNVMFPSETANNGSARVNENQQIQIPAQSWFQFDEQQGTEKIWVVWSEKDVPQLEAIKGFANSKDRGVVSSPGLRTALNEFLKTHSSTNTSVERDVDKKETTVKANDAILVYAVKLEHH